MMNDLPSRLRRVSETLDAQFLGKDEVIRLLLIAVVAGEHAVLIGPPGTAKSALIRTLAELLRGALLRVPAHALHRAERDLRPGRHRRVPRGHLPAQHRGHAAGGGDRLPRRGVQVQQRDPERAARACSTSAGSRPAARCIECPLISAFGASNEVPERRDADGDLRPLPAPRALGQPRRLPLQRAPPARHPARDPPAARSEAARRWSPRRAARARRTRSAQRMSFTRRVPLSSYKGLVFQIRAEGISLSDRRVVKMLKLFAASAFLDGRAQADASDFFVLKHIWNNEDQAAILEGIVQPRARGVLPRASRSPPRRRARHRHRGARRGDRSHPPDPHRGGAAERRAALQPAQGARRDQGGAGQIPDPRARELEQRVAQLLEASLKSGRFAEP